MKTYFAAQKENKSYTTMTSRILLVTNQLLTYELVKGSKTEISGSVGEEFSGSMDEGGEKDCVESEDELRNIGSSSDIEGENNLLVYREGDEKKNDFNYKVGRLFSSNSQFKWVVEVHEAVNRKSIKFTKNDK
ncbi:PREDICTED: uncharacterized protein LOC109179198 [Ipomoea nil]|uniref:uncharacterized protein LOC109179198 n=1 Tax=Ipomoea nil TaxID=35883 RepID=UPI0009009405|nr:PREDICTED: uncharacterized protein LOC109179198 [Ipomoea nil]